MESVCHERVIWRTRPRRSIAVSRPRSKSRSCNRSDFFEPVLLRKVGRVLARIHRSQTRYRVNQAADISIEISRGEKRYGTILPFPEAGFRIPVTLTRREIAFFARSLSSEQNSSSELTRSGPCYRLLPYCGNYGDIRDHASHECRSSQNKQLLYFTIRSNYTRHFKFKSLENFKI